MTLPAAQPASPAPTAPTAPRKTVFRRPALPGLPLDFLTRAAALPGKTLAVALAVCALSRASRSPTVILGRWALCRFLVSPDAAFDALTRQSDAGLIRTSRRRGRHARVTILDKEVLSHVSASGGVAGVRA